ncbi:MULTISPECIES: hybrid sensor histidine kinase/response regulator [Planktothrix]|uniref:histidine kinase n=1 Tax=Planktothrix mougeotii LEGE 06226 TaxID=1828728 RepID=A0ABR9U7N8_9CYAN|nr:MULTISPECIES: hybrid sensor histidine kinase/response regulator [Planktothrix]MBD2484348.1 hybrid sensor histidine kinase/response regulator [Planktothrix sp. FACHB-1365]MBE9142479.1 hybrid sensor histidine kinase/response regulator [Planktothrix mougeotii LEGE 06226]
MIKSDSILIVDDEPDVFDVLEGILFREGYQLHYASSGFEVFKFLEWGKPDLILLDVMMPDCDGMDICRQIKQIPEWNSIPIIMITALNSKETLAQCLEAGAEDFIGKPVSALEVRARVRSMLRLKKQHDELEKSRQKLEHLLQLREDMAYAVIHDLRNPVVAITLACELLTLTDLTEKQSQKVEQIAISGKHLNNLINSLLLMAKLESGKALLNPQLVNLSAMVQEVVNEFEAQTIKKKINLTATIPEAKRLVMADPDLIKRVLENLLNNAIKFSPTNSWVSMEVEYPPDANIVKVYIRDSGRGVKDELKQSIFQKYEIGQRFEGVNQTGLGLAFCKMVIDAHQGCLSLTDNQPKGSIFTLELNTEYHSLLNS